MAIWGETHRLWGVVWMFFQGSNKFCLPIPSMLASPAVSGNISGVIIIIASLLGAGSAWASLDVTDSTDVEMGRPKKAHLKHGSESEIDPDGLFDIGPQTRDMPGLFEKAQEVLTHFGVAHEPDPQPMVEDIQSMQSLQGLKAIMPYFDSQKTY